jgi:hypothetical protein
MEQSLQDSSCPWNFLQLLAWSSELTNVAYPFHHSKVQMLSKHRFAYSFRQNHLAPKPDMKAIHSTLATLVGDTTLGPSGPHAFDFEGAATGAPELLAYFTGICVSYGPTWKATTHLAALSRAPSVHQSSSAPRDVFHSFPPLHRAPPRSPKRSGPKSL